MTHPAHRWATWLWLWAGWTALALFLGLSSSLAYLSAGNPPRWSLTIRMALAETYVWAALAPLVMWLARRFPFSRAALPSRLAVHVPASLVISAVKLFIDRGVRLALFGFSTYVAFTSLAPNLLFYWGIVATAHGLSYYRSSKDKEVRAAQLEARLARARLEILQMQMHPHFLFNTLNAISELVHEDPDTADRMISALSELLREALVVSDTRETTLDRELALVGRYLEIQQARFGDRLEVDLTVDPAVRGALVPHLVLQPIVENAIRHGVGARPGAGHIRIAARPHARSLVVTVEDDGPGVGNNSLQERIGLGNTRAVLQQLYGRDHRLTLQDAPGGGAVLTLTIPLRTSAQ